MTGLSLFWDKVFADSVCNLDPLPYLCIMTFLFRREVREQSQAKPNRLRILLNSKPVNPCMRGNLTFLHFYLSNGYGTVWFSRIGDGSGPKLLTYKVNTVPHHLIYGVGSGSGSGQIRVSSCEQMDGAYPYLLIRQNWIGGLNANSWIRIQRRFITYIQCSGSMTFWYGSLSRSSDPYLWLTFPDAGSRGSKHMDQTDPARSGTLVYVRCSVYHSSKQCCGSETKVSDPVSDPELYLWLMGPDPGSPKTCR